MSILKTDKTEVCRITFLQHSDTLIYITALTRPSSKNLNYSGSPISSGIEIYGQHTQTDRQTCYEKNETSDFPKANDERIDPDYRVEQCTQVLRRPHPDIWT